MSSQYLNQPIKNSTEIRINNATIDGNITVGSSAALNWERKGMVVEDLLSHAQEKADVTAAKKEWATWGRAWKQLGITAREEVKLFQVEYDKLLKKFKVLPADGLHPGLASTAAA